MESRNVAQEMEPKNIGLEMKSEDLELESEDLEMESEDTQDLSCEQRFKLF